MRGRNSSKNHDQALNLQLLGRHKEESAREDHYWLDREFERLPYKLYRCWLILAFVIVLATECFILLAIWTAYKKSKFKEGNELAITLVFAHVSCLSLLVGCKQMLSGMEKKTVIITQQGIMKFKISMVFSIGVLLFGLIGVRDFLFYFPLLQISMFGLPLIEIINLFGGFAVIRAFKQNHPLQRPDQPQDMDDELLADTVQQNQVLASEVSSCDQELDKRRIYKFWLWYSFFFSAFLFNTLLVIIIAEADEEKILAPVCVEIYFLLNGFCNYEMLVAIKRRMLNRSKRAIFLLKILISVTGIFTFTGVMIIERNIFWALFAVVLLIWHPVATLKGALGVQKILEQREKFAKLACFSGDAYIHFANA